MHEQAQASAIRWVKLAQCNLKLSDGLVERLTLDLGNLLLQSRRSSGTVTTSEGTCTIWRGTVHLVQVGDLWEGVLVAQWHEDHTVVDDHGQGVENSGLLSTTWGTGGNEETNWLTGQGTRGPQATGGVPEGLPLGWVGTVSGWNTEQEGVVAGQGLQGGNWVVWLWRSVHLLQNLLRQSLWHSEDVDRATGGGDTLGDGLGHGGDVVVNSIMKIAIIYYSTFGHVVKMAEAIKEGADKSGSAAQVDIFQVAETLPQEVLEKMGAPPKADYPIATMDTLQSYDAFVFGYPTRFGTVPAQFSAFMDTTGGLWMSGALFGKPAALFTSVSSNGGAPEATLRNFITYLTHHGMVYVPLGYAKAFAELTSFDEIHGGTPYGSSVISAVEGSPTELEKKIARIQGESFAEIATKFTKTESATEGIKKEAKEVVGTKEDKAVAEEPKEVSEDKVPEKRETQRKPQTETAEKSGCAKCVIM